MIQILEMIKRKMYSIIHLRVKNDNIKQAIFRDIEEYFKELND